MSSRYTTTDMPEVTLTMLQRLDDFENYVLDAEDKLRDQAPESSRVQSKVVSHQVQLKNLKGCIDALKVSIRLYRELSWKEKKTGT